MAAGGLHRNPTALATRTRRPHSADMYTHARLSSASRVPPTASPVDRARSQAALSLPSPSPERRGELYTRDGGSAFLLPTGAAAARNRRSERGRAR